MGTDISNMYLNTPLNRFEYMHISYSNYLPDIIPHYNLASKIATSFIYIEIRGAMYGLKQAGKLANQQLEKVLATGEYFPSKYTPGMYLHETHPISFTLVVNEFGVKYINKKDALHLDTLISNNYPIKSK